MTWLSCPENRRPKVFTLSYIYIYSRDFYSVKIHCYQIMLSFGFSFINHAVFFSGTVLPKKLVEIMAFRTLYKFDGYYSVPLGTIQCSSCLTQLPVIVLSSNFRIFIFN